MQLAKAHYNFCLKMTPSPMPTFIKCGFLFNGLFCVNMLNDLNFSLFVHIVAFLSNLYDVFGF